MISWFPRLCCSFPSRIAVASLSNPASVWLVHSYHILEVSYFRAKSTHFYLEVSKAFSDSITNLVDGPASRLARVVGGNRAAAGQLV